MTNLNLKDEYLTQYKTYHKFVVFLHILHLISSFNDGIDVIYDGSLTGKV